MRAGWREAVLVSLLALGLASQGAEAALELGSRGPSVAVIQGYLNALGLLAALPDGVYGPATREAVRAFQRRENLVVDGVVGVATLSRLQVATGGARTIIHRVSRGDTVYGIARHYGTSTDKVIALNDLTEPRKLQPGQTLKVPARPGDVAEQPAAPPAWQPGQGAAELVPWSEMRSLFPNGAEERVMDVRTGITFRVRRIQGTYHADCEPVGLDDTAAVKAAYGGQWSWDRHAIVVEVGGRQVAASMNGFPHGTGHYARNGYPGHFCIHFYGSRTHGSQVVDPDHQAAILKAARKYQKIAAVETSGEQAPATGAEALRTED